MEKDYHINFDIEQNPPLFLARSVHELFPHYRLYPVCEEGGIHSIKYVG